MKNFLVLLVILLTYSSYAQLRKSNTLILLGENAEYRIFTANHVSEKTEGKSNDVLYWKVPQNSDTFST